MHLKNVFINRIKFNKKKFYFSPPLSFNQLIRKELLYPTFFFIPNVQKKRSKTTRVKREQEANEQKYTASRIKQSEVPARIPKLRTVKLQHT